MTEESNKPIDEPNPSQELDPAEGNPDGAQADPSAQQSAGETDATEEALPDAPPEEQTAIETDAVASESEIAEQLPEPPAPEPALNYTIPEPTVPVHPSARQGTREGEERRMDWYILKVQSNREDSIRDGLIRRVKIAGLEEYFGEVIVPTEKVTEFKAGKKRVTKRKLYPGYIVVNMEINEDTWFLVRETPGIGDFTGAAGTPTPMLPHEVQRILAKKEEKQDEVPKLKIGFRSGDRVKINDGTFENFEGEVHTIDETSGRVTVMINIFGRSTPVELEYWQIESV
ncbi:MAG: transcription termination/antitermination protein NusG [Thermoguttaceae bacterium]